MLPQIKILEEEGLIIKEEKRYILTDIGQPVVYHLKPFEDTLAVIDRQKKFLQEHDLKALPHDFFLRIGEIQNMHIIEAEVEDSFEPHSWSIEMTLKSEEVAVLSPIVHPKYPQSFLFLARKGCDVHTILTKNAYSKIKNEYYEMLLEGLRYDNARLSICEDNIRFANTVTDVYFSLNLFTKNGVFDSIRDVVSYDSSALRFGKDLFSYYLDKSYPVSKDGSY